VPVLILISMAVPAARVLVQTEDPVATELTIRVTGYQWKWGYEYVDTGVTVLSTLSRDSNRARQLGSGIDPYSVPNYLLSVDHPLVVPAGVKVRVLITAQDVIHSWWVPALAIKKDAIPGFINEAWFDIDADKTGTYRGQCAELCGRDHGFMPIVLEVKSKQDFDQWLKEQQRGPQAAGRAASLRPGEHHGDDSGDNPGERREPGGGAACRAAQRRLNSVSGPSPARITAAARSF
jgi:cytochrome c oxidase subunit 2